MAKRKKPKPPARRARGTGSVTRDKARGVWIGRRPVGRYASGRTRYVEVSAPTQAECVAKLAAAAPAGPKTTLKEWAATWLAGLDLKGLSIDAYRTALEVRVLPALGHLRVAALTTAQVEDATRAWGKTLAPVTVANTLAALRTCLGAAVRAGVAAANPAAHARRPKVVPKKIDPFSPAELARIVADCTPIPNARCVALLAATGIRAGECRALLVTDFDPATGLLSVTKGHQGKHGVGTPKSRNSVRTIRVPAAAVPAVVAAIGGRESGPLFAPHGRRQGHDSVRGEYVACLARLGLARRKMHQLRHSVATALIGAGVGLGDVAAYLGDTVAVVVRTYVHATGADPAAALDRVLLHGNSVGEPAKKPVSKAKTRS